MKTGIVLDKVEATRASIVLAVGTIKVDCAFVRRLDVCVLGNNMIPMGVSLEPVDFPVNGLRILEAATASLGNFGRLLSLFVCVCLRLCMFLPARACVTIQANIRQRRMAEKSTVRAIGLVRIINLRKKPEFGVEGR